ncbi:hypothetical protein Tsubulata_015936 [Turnera subulata]|uniref:Thioredoxin domain-containing protein n=1 Tax=Turnera subulata TaxID=218843 RepID=A0A9Q0G9E3_9ROSI|nr:hypothetical protein Tsubulata_015936 [Turnera subulata]
MAEEGQVIACHTQEAWREHLVKGRQSNKLFVVYFTASWCEPSKLMSPVVDELAKKFPDVLFLKVDVDELESVAKDWGVEGTPKFVFLKDHRVMGKFVGANKGKLLELTQTHAVA